jgi:hypothetical protein
MAVLAIPIVPHLHLVVEVVVQGLLEALVLLLILMLALVGLVYRLQLLVDL